MPRFFIESTVIGGAGRRSELPAGAIEQVLEDLRTAFENPPLEVEKLVTWFSTAGTVEEPALKLLAEGLRAHAFGADPGESRVENNRNTVAEQDPMDEPAIGPLVMAAAMVDRLALLVGPFAHLRVEVS